MVTSIAAVVVILCLLIVSTINVFMLISAMSTKPSKAHCCKIVALVVDIVLVLLVIAKVGGFYL